MARTRYFFDEKELVYKEIQPSFAHRLLKFLLIFVFSLILAGGYGIGFKYFFGSPKENRLQSDMDEIKYKYNLLSKDFVRIERDLTEVASVEDNVYRPVFNMEQIPSSFRQSGYGGTRKYTTLEGYENSGLMISATRTVDELVRKTYIQSRSFEEIIPLASEWKDSISHIPFVRPVNVNIPLGDGLKFREKHPVLGSPQWHYGQDFTAPSGTEVFATGDGKVIRARWSPYGFGNVVELAHGYGFNTIYGHLSAVKVSRGQEVKRGELLGLSGSTGISSGPHLHYEIHYNGRVQNPLYFFDDDLTMDEYNRMIDVFHEGTR